MPAARGRADSGDIEIDLVELFTDVGGLAADAGKGIAIFIDEMQDLGPDDVSALCAACHEIVPAGAAARRRRRRAAAPAGGAVGAASPTASGCSATPRIDRLDRDGRRPRAAARRPREEDAEFDDDALAAMYEATGGYPYFVQAYGKVAWDVAPRSPITAADVAVAAPEAEAELAVGFFGSRYERATPAEREYLRAMAERRDGADGDRTTPVADRRRRRALGRKPQSLSPARDALLKKGLIYSGERGRIAFTVPHFGRYLRSAG